MKNKNAAKLRKTKWKRAKKKKMVNNKRTSHFNNLPPS